MSRSPFDTSFLPLGPTIAMMMLVCSSYQPQPLPSVTRSYKSNLKPRPIERSSSLLLSMPVLGVAVSRGQQAKYAHSISSSLMPEVAYCRSHLFLARSFSSLMLFLRPIFLTTCVVYSSWRATLLGVDLLLRV